MGKDDLKKHNKLKDTNIIINNTSVSYVNSGFTNSFSGKSKKHTAKDIFKDFKIHIQKSTSEELILDFVGPDPSIANALRRILLSEIPTVAIEKVFIENNTSVMQDEVLAHRLGLIPIKVNPKLFDFPPPPDEDVKSTSLNAVPEGDEKYNLVFTLNVTCKLRHNGEIENQMIYSRHLQWQPIGNQSDLFTGDDIPCPVHGDIPIIKLRPGQTVKLTVHCTKGIGRDHAKFSPVATASYRLLPEIIFKREFTGEEGAELVKKCPMNVFDIEDSRAVVARPRSCSVCRECIRDPKMADGITLTRVRNHFLFSIESTGIISPTDLFIEAIQILKEKCSTLDTTLDKAAEEL